MEENRKRLNSSVFFFVYEIKFLNFKYWTKFWKKKKKKFVVLKELGVCSVFGCEKVKGEGGDSSERFSYVLSLFPEIEKYKL